MKSATPGQGTSQAEVTNVSPHGFWLFVGERELFVSFKEFPSFQEASVREITNVELPRLKRIRRSSNVDANSVEDAIALLRGELTAHRKR
jgi:hypothetical protein